MDNIDFLIKDAVYKFLTQAEKGTVYINYTSFFINFENNLIKRTHKHTNLDIPMLEVKNENVFFELIKKYILSTLEVRKFYNSQLENLIFQRLVHLFCNATYDDFNNIERHIEKVINFHHNKLIDKTIIKNVDCLDNSDIVINVIKQGYEMETPYAITFTIQKEINGEIYQCDLPNISIGISGNTCYIYSVQHPKNSQNNVDNFYNKKIKRLLYKVNAGLVNEFDDEIVAIDKVSPSAIISLSILFSILNNLGINEIEVVPFLPVRFHNKYFSNNSIASYLIDCQPDEYDTAEKKESIIKEFEEKTIKLQNNLTQKFIMDFFRLQYHFNSIVIRTFPQEYNYNSENNDNIQIISVNELYTDNKFLSEIVDKTRQALQNKVK